MGSRNSTAKAVLFFAQNSWVKVMMGITVNEAGRRGGLSLLTKRGNNHFSEIGKKGQKALRKRYPSMASIWGKKGGRPRKNNI